MICPLCKKWCSDLDSRERPRKVCSRQCALRKGRPKHIPFYVNCFYCSKKVRKNPATLKYTKSGKLYCNKSCKAKQEMSKPKVIIFCKYCGKILERWPSAMRNNNFCSRKCHGYWLRQFVGKEARAWKGGYNKTERTRIRSRMTWKELRQKILEKYDYSCSKCGVKNQIHVHHIIPWRLGGEDNLDNLISLCPICHSKQTIKDWEKENQRNWKEFGAHTFKGNQYDNCSV